MPSKRILQLDGLRGLAIAAVFIHHAYHAKLLWMGVDLFFCLSGFLITSILLKAREKDFRKYIGAFYARRVRRILPAYVVIMIVVSVIFEVSWARYWYLYLGGMNFLKPLHLTDMQWIPLWSLAVEEQFYFIWPIAVFYLDRKWLASFAVSLMILAPVLRYLCTPLFHSHWAIYMLLPFRMDNLAAGALIAIIWPQVSVKPGRMVWAGGSLIALSLASLVLLSKHGFTTYSNTQTGNLWVYEATLAITASLLVMALAGVGRKILTLRPLMFLGTVSYSVYLSHLAALELAPRHNVAIAAVGTMAYASIMWFWIEKPILDYRAVSANERQKDGPTRELLPE
jgi:peptidoglycan/LPS O-acetylase OafA/YrhL